MIRINIVNIAHIFPYVNIFPSTNDIIFAKPPIHGASIISPNKDREANTMGKQEMVHLAAEILMELPYEKTEFVCNMVYKLAVKLGIRDCVNIDTEKED